MRKDGILETPLADMFGIFLIILAIIISSVMQSVNPFFDRTIKVSEVMESQRNSETLFSILRSFDPDKGKSVGLAISEAIESGDRRTVEEMIDERVSLVFGESVDPCWIFYMEGVAYVSKVCSSVVEVPLLDSFAVLPADLGRRYITVRLYVPGYA